MEVVYIFPDGRETPLSNKTENLFLPIPGKIKIANCEQIFINSELHYLEDQVYSMGYHGEALTLIGQGEEYIIRSYGKELPDQVRKEYLDFAHRLNNNYADEKINQESLFLSIENSDIPEVGIGLCTFEREVESIKSDSKLKLIHSLRNHIQQVFMHPKIHLRDEREVLPVEVVTRISHETITHLASHSEHWESRRASGLVPSRLLASTLEDKYAIYENVVAKNLVDQLYKYVLAKRKKLKTIELSAKESYTTLNNEVNNVYIAQNILFRGYAEGISKEVSDITEAQKKMVDEILEVLIFCRESTLYSKLRKAGKVSSPLKATNIFMMDKHYKHIYGLWNSLKLADDVEDIENQAGELTNEYTLFCETLLLFALKYFNFTTADPYCNLFSHGQLSNTTFSFKEWSCWITLMAINELAMEATVLEFSKGKLSEFAISDINPDILKAISKEFSKMDSSFISFSENTLTFQRTPTEGETTEICRLLYPDAHKRDTKAQMQRLELRVRISEYFKQKELETVKALLLPLSFMFSDSESDIDGCLALLQDEIRKILIGKNIRYCYFLTPLRPNDYDSAERQSGYHAELLLKYPFIQSGDAYPVFGIIPVSLRDINSFRRLTKILLTHMIEVDPQHQYCPLCGSQLMESDGVYSCYNCAPQFELRETKCPWCGKYYLNSQYAKPNFVINEKAAYKLMMNEIRNGFKNITDIDPDSQQKICPHCGALN